MQLTNQTNDPESQTTGFPGLRSWRVVYALVTIIFFIYVALLAMLTRWHP
jgi:hypothetical protein